MSWKLYRCEGHAQATSTAPTQAVSKASALLRPLCMPAAAPVVLSCDDDEPDDDPLGVWLDPALVLVLVAELVPLETVAADPPLVSPLWSPFTSTS